MKNGLNQISVPNKIKLFYTIKEQNYNLPLPSAAILRRVSPAAPSTHAPCVFGVHGRLEPRTAGSPSCVRRLVVLSLQC